MRKSRPSKDDHGQSRGVASPPSEEIKQAKALTEAARATLARTHRTFENTRRRVKDTEEILQHTQAWRERQVELGNLPPPTPPQPVIDILLIEDSLADAMLFRHVLKECGVRCQLTVLRQRSEVEAFFTRIASSEHPFLPRLIIADCMIPGIETEDLMAAVHSVPTYQHVPVILFSTLAEEEGERRRVRCGATAFIYKPGELTAFVEAVSTMMRRWSGMGGGGSDVTLANPQ